MASNTKAPAAEPAAAPVMVEVNSPEFHAAVRAALAAHGMNVTGASPQADAGAVSRTSIDMSQPGLDDLTVRFNRFCVVQNCGYQRNQEAGFPRHIAEQIVAGQSGFIVHDPRRSR